MTALYLKKLANLKRNARSKKNGASFGVRKGRTTGQAFNR